MAVEYHDKFIVLKKSLAVKNLNHDEIDRLNDLLGKASKGAENYSYLVVNTDEPYAEKVKQIILEGEDQKENSSTQLVQMGLLDAIDYSRLQSKSFTNLRWTPKSQSDVQYYVEDNVLYCQNYDNKPEIKSIGTSQWAETFIPYTGPYERWSKINKVELKRLEELKEILNPYIELFQEYKRLTKKYKE